VSVSSTPTRYGAVAQAFHWLTVILVGAAYLLGEGGPESRIYAAERASQLSLHETLGMAVLVVLVLRLAWRLFDRAPDVEMAGWMRAGSRLVHLVLYALLAAVPATAILGAWFEGHAVTLLGLGDLGPLTPLNHALGEELSELHEVLANAIIWIAGLHAAAALFHHFFLRDRVLASMLPFGGARS
jgi:cytochrome b561